MSIAVVAAPVSQSVDNNRKPCLSLVDGSLRGSKGNTVRCPGNRLRQSRGCPRNCKRRAERLDATGESWEGGARRRPASQETCHHRGQTRARRTGCADGKLVRVPRCHRIGPASYVRHDRFGVRRTCERATNFRQRCAGERLRHRRANIHQTVKHHRRRGLFAPELTWSSTGPTNPPCRSRSHAEGHRITRSYERWKATVDLDATDQSVPCRP